jgi:hypothetical protein
MSDIIIRDKTVEQLKNQLLYRNKLLAEKRQHIKKTKNENEFLNEVDEQFEPFYNEKIDEKKKQIESLNNLYDYLDTILDNVDVSSSTVRNAKSDQSYIRKKIKDIEKELSLF